MAGAVAFGVVLGTPARPQVAYLARRTPLAVVAEQLAGEEPTRVLRIAGRCEEQRCAHFESGHCSLGRRVDETLPPVVDVLPRCAIRSSCRWYAERGGSVCLRCPQVLTRDAPRPGNEALRVAARPPS